MKRHLNFILGILCLTIFISSCRKKAFDDEPFSHRSYGTNFPYTSQVIFTNQMLVFDNENVFYNTIDYLEEQNKDFGTYHNVEQMIEDSTNIEASLDSVCNVFEASYIGFNSMRRAALNNIASKLLSGAEIDGSLDECPIRDYYTRAVFNSLGEVGIGNEIWKVTNDGMIYKILDGDLNILGNLRSGNFSDTLSADPSKLVWEQLYDENLGLAKRYDPCIEFLHSFGLDPMSPVGIRYYFNANQIVDTSSCELLWDFGDGNTTRQWKNVNHIYTSPGQYIVSVKMVKVGTTEPCHWCGNGHIESTRIITVVSSQVPPCFPTLANDIIMSTSSCPNYSFSPNGAYGKILWKAINSAGEEEWSSTTTPFTFSPKNSGTYQICMYVSSESGCVEPIVCKTFVLESNCCCDLGKVEEFHIFSINGKSYKAQLTLWG